MVKASGPITVSSLLVWSEMLEMTGRPLIVRTNEVLLVPPSPSAAVIVMVTTPHWSDGGMTVTVRLVPVPPRKIRFAGTSTGSLEAAESSKLAAGVSASSTVKLIGPSASSWKMDWPGMCERMGPSLTGLIVSRNDAPLVPPLGAETVSGESVVPMVCGLFCEKKGRAVAPAGGVGEGAGVGGGANWAPPTPRHFC